MPTIQNNLAMVRRLLASPSPQTPDDALLFELLSNQVLHHRSQLDNSSEPWSINEWSFTTAPDVEDYLVTATDFGKPFWCYTFDSTQQNSVRIELPFCKLQNTDQFYSGPVQPYGTNSGTNSTVPTISTLSFYRKSDAYYIRTTPMPNATAEIHVFYETAPTEPQALGETPGLTAFHHLLRVQTALSALPYCGWASIRSDSLEAKEAAAWERKIKALAMALTKQEADFQRQFDTYLGNLMRAGVERRAGYGDGYLDGTDMDGSVGCFGGTWNIGF